MVKQGLLCSHTLGKCLNCNGNRIAFSSRCAKKRDANKVAGQSRKTGITGWASVGKAMNTATGMHRAVFGRRPRGGARAGGGSEEEEMADEMTDEMADVQEDEEAGEERDIMMTETETATPVATHTETETEVGALATIDKSDPSQLRKVIRRDDCGAGDVSRTQGGQSVLAKVTERTKKIGISHSAYVIRQSKRVWMAIWRGRGLVFDEQTDLSRGANEDVIATDIRRRGERIPRIINVYDQKNRHLGERPPRKLNWQRVIRQGSTVLMGDFNAHSIR